MQGKLSEGSSITSDGTSPNDRYGSIKAKCLPFRLEYWLNMDLEFQTSSTKLMRYFLSLASLCQSSYKYVLAKVSCYIKGSYSTCSICIYAVGTMIHTVGMRFCRNMHSYFNPTGNKKEKLLKAVKRTSNPPNFTFKNQFSAHCRTQAIFVKVFLPDWVSYIGKRLSGKRQKTPTDQFLKTSS